MLLQLVEPAVRAQEELVYRKQNSRLTPEAIYNLIMLAYNDPVLAAKHKTQLMLESMPPIERPDGI